MGERGLEYKVGLLIVASTAILLGFIFILGNYSLSPGFTIRVDYDYVGSLAAGAPVKLSGIKVGKVTAVDLWGGVQDPEAGGQRVQVRVTAWVEDRAHDAIRSDAEFFINTAGVLGEQYLEIVPGKDWSRPPLASGAIVHDAHVHDPPRTDLVVARLYEVLDGVSGVLRDDRDEIKHLLSNGASAVAEVNQLLIDNRAKIGELIGGATLLARHASITLDKLNAGLGDGKPVASLLASADGALVAARASLTTLTPPASSLLGDATRVTGLITEQRLGGLDRALDGVATATGRAGTLLDGAGALVSDLRAGKGTAGALLSRDELYTDLRELIRDLKRNPWKFFWKE